MQARAPLSILASWLTLAPSMVALATMATPACSGNSSRTLDSRSLGTARDSAMPAPEASDKTDASAESVDLDSATEAGSPVQEDRGEDAGVEDIDAAGAAPCSPDYSWGPASIAEGASWTLQIRCAKPNGSVSATCITQPGGGAVSDSYGTTDAHGDLTYQGLVEWGSLTSYTCNLLVDGNNVFSAEFTKPCSPDYSWGPSSVAEGGSWTLSVRCATPNAQVSSRCITQPGGGAVSDSYGTTDANGDLVREELVSWGLLTSYSCDLLVGGVSVLTSDFTKP
jgi:hypothetical protein